MVSGVQGLQMNRLSGVNGTVQIANSVIVVERQRDEGPHLHAEGVISDSRFLSLIDGLGQASRALIGYQHSSNTFQETTTRTTRVNDINPVVALFR